jgi:hypothetical protein
LIRYEHHQGRIVVAALFSQLPDCGLGKRKCRRNIWQIRILFDMVRRSTGFWATTDTVIAPTIVAKASAIKSLRRAWQPGTNNCANSTAPEKTPEELRLDQSSIHSLKRMQRQLPNKVRNAQDRLGRPVSGRRAGGTTERTTIAVANPNATDVAEIRGEIFNFAVIGLLQTSQPPAEAASIEASPSPPMRQL